ncbi:MAG: flagellar hook-length control protein FliK [Nitrospirae bacterium]|nr:flagellar hook-length control protein FliK [Nitrospirota bacterium]
MPLPLDITSPVNQKNPLSAASMHGRSSTGHSDGLSADPNGIVSDDRFKKEITDFLLSLSAIPIIQAQTSIVSPKVAPISRHTLYSDTFLSPLLRRNNIGSPFILAEGQVLNPDGGNAEAKRAVPLQEAASFRRETGKALRSLLIRDTAKSAMGCHSRESGNPEDVDFSNPGFPIKPFGNDELDFCRSSNISKDSARECRIPGLLMSGEITDLIKEKIFGNGNAEKEDGFASISDITIPEKGESGTSDPSKVSIPATGKTGQDPALGALQPEDGGDVNNRPSPEKMPRLSFKNDASDSGNFREGLEENKERPPEKTTLNRISTDSNPDLNLNGSYSRLPAPLGNTRRTEAGPLQTASPEKTSFSFHEVSDVSSKRPIYLFKDDTSSLRINLDGDDLGKLKLDISIRDNMVKANIVTEHPIVKEVIEINQGQLKDALSGHGLEISYLSVSVEGGQSEGLNYKEVIENSSSSKNHDREIKEEDAILACNTLSQQDSSVNIFV